MLIGGKDLSGLVSFLEALLFPIDELVSERDLDNANYLILTYPDQPTGGWGTASKVIGSEMLEIGTDFKIDFVMKDAKVNRRQLHVREISVQLEKPPLSFDRAVDRVRSFF